MIKLYSQPTCGMCNFVHMLLDRKGIEYTECQDVDYMQNIGINHTPTLDVDGTLYIGKAIIDWINSRG